jgi:H+/Cl- antiporter ClcA
LILAGSAAGVAAAFNTPFAGIVFGIEEMSRSFETRTSGLVITTVIAAGLTSLAIMGNYTYFGVSSALLRNGVDWLAIALCGVAGGLAGGLFGRFVVVVAHGLPGFLGNASKRHRLIFAAVCGLGVAVCGLMSNDMIFGTGYAQVKGALEGGATLPWHFGVLKLAATALSTVSGIPGGIFSPSLAVGAGIGANVAALFPQTPAGAVMLLGMVAYFAGVVQAPITSFVIVIEMTDNHAMVVPLMAASLIGYAASRCLPSGHLSCARRRLPRAAQEAGDAGEPDSFRAEALSLADAEDEHAVVLPAFLQRIAGLAQQVRDVDRGQRVGAFENQNVARGDAREGLARF